MANTSRKDKPYRNCKLCKFTYSNKTEVYTEEKSHYVSFYLQPFARKLVQSGPDQKPVSSQHKEDVTSTALKHRQSGRFSQTALVLHHFNNLKKGNYNVYVFSIFAITSLLHPMSHHYFENHSPCFILVTQYLLSEMHLLSRLQFPPIAFLYIKISLICPSVYFFPSCASMCIFCQPCSELYTASYSELYTRCLHCIW